MKLNLNNVNDEHSAILTKLKLFEEFNAIEELKFIIQEFDDKISELKEELKDKSDECIELKDNIKDQKSSYDNEIRDLQKEIEALEYKNSDLSSLVDELNADIDNFHAQLLNKEQK